MSIVPPVIKLAQFGVFLEKEKARVWMEFLMKIWLLIVINKHNFSQNE